MCLGAGSLAFFLDQIFPEPSKIESLSGLGISLIEVASQIALDLFLLNFIARWLSSNNLPSDMVPMSAALIVPMAQPNLLNKSVNIYMALQNLFHGAKSIAHAPVSKLNTTPPVTEGDTSRQRTMRHQDEGLVVEPFMNPNGSH